MEPHSNPAEEEQVAASRRIYEGRVISLRVDSVTLPDGRSTVREVVEHEPVVVVVPLDDQGNVLLVRQYRLPAQRFLLELPAGGIDPGESPEEAVQRELQEETGQRAGRLERLGGFFISPGYCDEYMHLFLATDLQPSSLPADTDERIEVVRVPLREALGMAERGEIYDVKTVAGLWMGASRKGYNFVIER